MAARRSGSDSLRRRAPSRDRKKRILVYCEGVATEPEYFKGLMKYLKAIPVDVVRCEVKGIGCDPLTVVKRAEQRWDEDRRKNRTEAYDEVWCVVDQDDHCSLAEAISHARGVGIHVVVSSPCFDYWLLLHYVEHHKQATAKEVARQLGKHIPGYNKRLPAAFPFDRHPVAAGRARLAKANEIGANPTTAVPLVVDAIRSVASR